jgi:hypothetical protein
LPTSAPSRLKTGTLIGLLDVVLSVATAGTLSIAHRLRQGRSGLSRQAK